MPGPTRELRGTSSSSTVSAPRSARRAPRAIYAETRADDMVVRCIRELLQRHPALPPVGWMTSRSPRPRRSATRGYDRRTAALLAGLPNTVPGYADRPDVRGRA